MIETLKLNASQRSVLGKKNRFLRRQGRTPVHLYGHGVDSLALECDTAQLLQIVARAGGTRPVSLEISGDKNLRNVFIREIQRDAISQHLIHVDFYQLRKGEKIKIDMPIIIVGEAPALKTKGRMLSHGITSLSIECLPEDIPSRIEVDISVLREAEQSIHVRDIALKPEVIVHDDPDQLVAKISEAVIRQEEAAAVPSGEKAEVPAEGAEAAAETGEKAEGKAGAKTGEKARG